MISSLSFSLIAVPLLVFMVTLSLIWWLIKGNTLKILDRPNSRSLHTTPVTRTGGLGMLPGILISWAFLPAALPLPVWIGVSLLAAVSFADDILTLSVWWRLLTHSAVAAWFAAVLLADAHGWLIATVATVAIVWIINLYNFMDGSDGLAGGMTLIGFGCYGLAAWLVGNETFAILNFCIVAAAAAFLLFNIHPARIFMGDVGAIPLGFLAAVFGILGWINGLWLLWLPLLIFSPFVADASVTLAKRCLCKEKIWQPHREHYYQRLVLSGFGHYNTALFGYVLMLSVGASAVWAAGQDESIQLGVGTAWCGVYLAMMLAFDLHWRRRNSG
jgi:UDP-N-acetylmuramyl pentapeptide phosphotransferase/UDP-N-acetylglucosamine-1-phosphate transferase